MRSRGGKPPYLDTVKVFKKMSKRNYVDIIDNKLDNLIGVLNYPLEDTKRHNTFGSLFEFGD